MATKAFTDFSWNLSQGDIPSGAQSVVAQVNLRRDLSRVVTNFTSKRAAEARRSADPPEHRGCLFATMPDDTSRGDILFFRFYPENIPYEIRTQLVSENVPGRAFPVHQTLGGGGMGLNLSLQFYDAFLPKNQSDPNNFFVKTRASLAYTWLSLYTIGHDGTGRALPDVDIYLQLGNGAARQVVIKGVSATAGQFDRLNLPQMLDAQVSLELVVPQEFTSPFQPKKAKQTRVLKKAPPAADPCVCVCPEGSVTDTPSGPVASETPANFIHEATEKLRTAEDFASSIVPGQFRFPGRFGVSL